MPHREQGVQSLFPLSVALLAGLQCMQRGVDGGRGRGSPSTTTPAPPPLPGPVDLTLPSEPLKPPLRNASTWGEFGWTTSGGSQILAPFLYNDRGWKVDELPLDKLLVPGVLFNVVAEAPNVSHVLTALTAEHLAAWEKRHGTPPPDSVLLIRFGGSPAKNGSAPAAATPISDLSSDAAAHLVAQGRVVGIGVDLPSLRSSVARILAEGDMYVLLNLDLSHELPAKGFSLLVMPSKVRGASASAVRVVAATRSPSPSRSSASRPATTLFWSAFFTVGVGALRALSVACGSP